MLLHWQHYNLIRCLLLLLVIMRLLFHLDKYDKLIALCVKDQLRQCAFPPLLLCKGPTHPIFTVTFEYQTKHLNLKHVTYGKCDSIYIYCMYYKHRCPEQLSCLLSLAFSLVHCMLLVISSVFQVTWRWTDMCSVEDRTLTFLWISEPTSSMHFCSLHTTRIPKTICW